MESKADLKSLTFEELKQFMSDLGEKPFRAKQIFQWLYRGVRTIDEMSDLAKPLREKLKEVSYIENIEIETKLTSKIDGTIKYLFRLSDGNYIESVLMSYKHGNTICISSQVGCKMGCRFCASTIGGLVRNLKSSEIIDQILKVREDSGKQISNVVMMGIGEPLDNYDNVVRFLKNVNHEDGLNIGYRHISLSTCGVVDKIYKLADEGFPITLSVSLHSPFDDKRSEIMPINKKHNLDSLMKSLEYYVRTTRRRISIEYALIAGINDSIECADRLVRLFGKILSHINLIPINNVRERSFQKSDVKSIHQFKDYLNNHGLNATVRRELGSDINAACGQLRRKQIEEDDGVMKE